MADKKIDIVFILGLMNGGGVESFVLNYCKNMSKDKFNFIFITSTASTKIPFKDIQELNAELYTINLQPKTLKDKVIKLISLYKIIKKYNNCIVHSNYMSAGSSLIIFLAGVKVSILHSHTYISQKNIKEIIKKFIVTPLRIFFYNTYFACGRATGKYIFKDKDFKIINNAINLNSFKFSQQKRDEIYQNLKWGGVDSDRIVFGHIGRFSREKNHKFLVEVFKEIKNLHSNSYFMLIGDGVLFDEIKQRVNELGLDKNVLFTGSIDNANEYYNAFDCLLLPSLNEGFPVVLVEAQANGLCCFVSDYISKETKILDSMEFLSLDKDAKAWARSILDRYKQTKFKRDEYAVCKVRDSGFDIATEAKKLEEIYISLKEKDE